MVKFAHYICSMFERAQFFSKTQICALFQMSEEKFDELVELTQITPHYNLDETYILKQDIGKLIADYINY